MKLPDAAIKLVISELRRAHPAIGVPTLRQTLRRRHGFSCGTDRLLRLLSEDRTETSKRSQQEAPSADVRALQNELEETRQRALLAEEREVAHQRYWAVKVDELRQELNRSRRPTDTPAPGSPRWLDLYKELQIARARITQLEAALQAALGAAK